MFPTDQTFKPVASVTTQETVEYKDIKLKYEYHGKNINTLSMSELKDFVRELIDDNNQMKKSMSNRGLIVREHTTYY